MRAYYSNGFFYPWKQFSNEFLSDSSSVVLNEGGVLPFGLDDDPIGEKISPFDGDRPDSSPDPDKVT